MSGGENQLVLSPWLVTWQSAHPRPDGRASPACSFKPIKVWRCITTHSLPVSHSALLLFTSQFIGLLKVSEFRPLISSCLFHFVSPFLVSSVVLSSLYLSVCLSYLSHCYKRENTARKKKYTPISGNTEDVSVNKFWSVLDICYRCSCSEHEHERN